MYNVEITPITVSIGKQVQRILIDPNTGEQIVQDMGIHRVALSASEFESQEAYEAAANTLAIEQIGRPVYVN